MRSIALVTFNGKNYIETQLDSIISQMEDDELIISDDGSTDGTIDILNSYSKRDNRIQVVKGPGQGVIKNFEYAITKCSGDLIFLADQDDIWYPNKLRIVTDTFSIISDRFMLVMHNGVESNNSGLIYKCNYKMHHGVIRNLLKSCYFGHRMAFKQELIKKCFPIPNICPAYDQYLGLFNEIKGTSYFIEDILTNHILHGDNLSQPLPLQEKIKHRLFLLKSIQEIYKYNNC
jgi:glycosyltransferase involved in cell wall biosynthesis